MAHSPPGHSVYVIICNRNINIVRLLVELYIIKMAGTGVKIFNVCLTQKIHNHFFFFFADVHNIGMSYMVNV